MKVLVIEPNSINRVATGRLAVIEPAEGDDLALVAVHDGEYQLPIGSSLDALLCGLSHTLRQQSRMRRRACDAEQ